MTRPTPFTGALACLAAAVLGAAPANAEVTVAAEDGFTIEIAIDTAATPEAAYAVLTRPETWWSPDHTYSLDAANLSLALEPGGCFCESWDGGAVKHAEVVQTQAPSLMRWIGGLGPLQSMALHEVHDWIVEPGADGGVQVRYVTHVSGRAGDGLATLAPVVDAVMTEQMNRLAARIEADADDAR